MAIDLPTNEAEVRARLVPVLLGGEILSYSFARCFYEAYGVKTLVMSSVDVRATSSSRFIDYRVVPGMDEGEAAFLEHVRALGAELRAQDKVPLVLGCADWRSRILSSHKQELEQWFVVPYNDFDLFDAVTQKEHFYRLCAELGITYPKTWTLGAQDSLDKVEGELPFPLIVKPSNSALYDLMAFAGKEKVYTVYDIDELRRVVDTVRGAGYADGLVLQDYVPGGDEAIRSLTTFSDATGRVRVVSGGRVVLQDHAPTAIGNPMCIMAERVEQIIDGAARFCAHTGYRGFANFDIKFDERDGTYKFFEVNARPGRNTYYMALGGANIARLLVDEYILPREIPYQEAYGDTLFTCVPARVIQRHVADSAVRDQALTCYREKRIGYPYACKQDTLAHAFWARVIWLHQIEKFKRYMEPVR